MKHLYKTKEGGMHEVLKKSITELETELDNVGYTDFYNYKEIVAKIEEIKNSHITLAEEKIKELEEECHELRKNFPDEGEIDDPFEAREFGRLLQIQEEIDKWKQFISELKRYELHR